MAATSIPTYYRSETYSFAFWRGGAVLVNRETKRSVILPASRELNIALGRLRMTDAHDTTKMDAMLNALDRMTKPDKYIETMPRGYVITLHQRPIE